MITIRNMKRTSYLLFTTIILSCTNGENNFDATGNFEADETIVSAEASGKILKLDIDEGQRLEAGQVVGYIDTTQLYLRKKQLEYSISAVLARQPDANSQLSTIQEQLATATKEKQRVENLLKADAATQKQLDDLNAQIELLKKQYNALQKSLAITTRSLQSETLPFKAQLEQVNDQLKKSKIINPKPGTVLTQYAMEEEVVNIGKALYKLADLNTIDLRVYISGTQLSQVKIGQTVNIMVDSGEDDYKKYSGIISWVSDKAEFTPKTIQTKEERANLVYAMKVSVKNDGYLKLGMYGEVSFKK
ncbi:HlyD family efflux transporter periplasmic adaptor subunit [bacterium]|nr:HlyD family efflux transporter periplasmic adaptor subunit [bacterium]